MCHVLRCYMDMELLTGTRIHIRRLFLYGSAQFGLTSVNSIEFTDVNGDPISTVRRRNLNFQFGAGYMLTDNKK